MRVLVLSSFVPFSARSRDAALFKYLVRNLQLAGIEAEGFRIPFTREPTERLIEEMAIARGIRISNVDRVIALNFPAYLVPWHDKMLWLGHQNQDAYDVGKSPIGNDVRGQQLARAIRTADSIAFTESERIYTLAPVTSRRLLEHNGVSSSTLRAPLNDPELFSGGESEGYVLAPGRVNVANRQHLLIRALRHVPGMRLIIAGPADISDADLLQRIAIEQKVQDRVMLDLRDLPRRHLARLVNGALAIACLPSEDDAFGPCCILEAFQASKPVLTASDAGDVLEFVRNGESGLVIQPHPEALGRGMAALADNPDSAARLGHAGRDAIRSAQLNWPATIEKLTAPMTVGFRRGARGRLTAAPGKIRLGINRRLAKAMAALSGRI